jgi:hypothetical protein
MSGESTGRDPAPESSTDKAMSTSGLPASASKFLHLLPYIYNEDKVLMLFLE